MIVGFTVLFTDGINILDPNSPGKTMCNWSDDIAKAHEIMEGDGDFLSDPILYKESTMALIKPLKTMFFGDNFGRRIADDIIQGGLVENEITISRSTENLDNIEEAEELS